MFCFTIQFISRSVNYHTASKFNFNDVDSYTLAMLYESIKKSLLQNYLLHFALHGIFNKKLPFYQTMIRHVSTEKFAKILMGGAVSNRQCDFREESIFRTTTHKIGTIN